MRFHDAILKLYSNNTNEILYVLRNSFHFSELSEDSNFISLHTGFYFYSHKKKLFELLYCIDNNNFYYQLTNSELLPLGAQMQIENVLYGRRRFVKKYIIY